MVDINDFFSDGKKRANNVNSQNDNNAQNNNQQNNQKKDDGYNEVTID